MINKLLILISLLTIPEAPKPPKYAVLQFTASWCGPCQNLKRNILNKEIQKAISFYDFYEIDIDKQQEYAKLYKVRAVPTIIVIKIVDGYGVELKRVIGYQTINQLKSLFALEK